jgi:predicted RNA-binding protein YlxR (DUF448 family)
MEVRELRVLIAHRGHRDRNRRGRGFWCNERHQANQDAAQQDLFGLDGLRGSTTDTIHLQREKSVPASAAHV